MNLSARERRLLVVLVAVLVVLAGVFLLGRLGGGADIPGLTFPETPSSPSAAVSSESPVFVIPPDARDPFSAKG